jgi:hypothetical protein
MPQLVRVMFGEPDYWPRLRQEVANSLTEVWAQEEIVYYVAGRANEQFLREHGAKQTVLVSDAPYLNPPEVGPYYSKTRLVAEAVRSHSEVLVTDFDCRTLKRPDARMWDVLRDKGGRYKGTMQVSSCCYVRRMYGRLVRLTAWPSARWYFNTCIIYCRDYSWMERWLAAYDDLVRLGLGTLFDGNDEAVFHYMIGTQLGVRPYEEMVADFEILILRQRKGTKEGKALAKPELYFWHR